MAFLALIAMAIARVKDLFVAVMLFGIYSLVSASFFVVLDAVDVAFTEAAVGAGISTLLMLATLMLTDRHEKAIRHRSGLAMFIIVITGALLIFGTLEMPFFGMETAPVHQHVAPRYINDSMTEIAVPNMVTSVLASYRGYDTFGETVVIFTAGMGVYVLLKSSKKTGKALKPRVVTAVMHQHMILRIVSKLLIPLILLFALYVQFHGDFGPGGGFQAGVIFAAGIILYAMLFGQNTARRLMNFPFIRVLSAVGVLLYGSVGIVSMLQGGSFLDYSVLAHDPIHGQHLGILLVELGVGITVATVMLIIFFMFTGRYYNRDEEY